MDEEDYGNDEGEVQAGAVEMGTIWNIGGVEINKVQKMEVENDPRTKGDRDHGGYRCWSKLLAREVAQEHP